MACFICEMKLQEGIQSSVFCAVYVYCGPIDTVHYCTEPILLRGMCEWHDQSHAARRAMELVMRS